MELLYSRYSQGKRTAYRAAKFFYLLFWVLKPFYLVKSGSMQIGDLCLGISFLLVLYCDEMHFRVDGKDMPLLYFVIAVGIINTIYAAAYQITGFIKPILYFVFNFMCVYVTRTFWVDSTFIRMWNTVLKFNLILQLAIDLSGIGRWYSGIRYMGTYNDPNQFAFAILSTYCLIYCLNRKQHSGYQWVFFFITLYLIFESSSVGLFFGVAIIFVFEQFFRLAKIQNNVKKVWYTAYLVLISVALVYVGSYFLLVITGVVKTNINVLQRIAEKFASGDVIGYFIKDRALEPFFNEPHRILYGGGEGYSIRFNASGHELHSTWLSILYYYGIAPFCLLIIWIKRNLNKVDWYILPVYLCIFAEAFTLINHRQPAFWVLILLGDFLKRRTDEIDLIE